MFENIGTFFKRIMKTEPKQLASKDAAKERLHLVLMQDRANVSVDFLELMKQEIIDVIKKYIEIDEKSIDVRLTNQANDDGTTGAPALYANIPIVNIKNDSKAEKLRENESDTVSESIEEVHNEIQTQEQNLENKEEIIELEKESIEKEEVKNEEAAQLENTEKENSEIIEDIKENDDEIDDVPTFDDLLKQSEEENKEDETSSNDNKSTNTNNQNNKNKNKNKNKKNN